MVAPRTGKQKDSQDAYMEKLQDIKVRVPNDVSTKTIEDICQLLQCQPIDLIEWKVDLKPELTYETRFKNED